MNKKFTLTVVGDSSVDGNTADAGSPAPTAAIRLVIDSFQQYSRRSVAANYFGLANTFARRREGCSHD